MKSKLMISAFLLVLAVGVSACAKKFSVDPTSPASPQNTATLTSTPSATGTFTGVPTNTATGTSTSTATSTVTMTPTGTFTPVSTPTPTRTFTGVPTSTGTATPTWTPTLVFTATATPSLTATSTSTETPVPTSTGTSAATDTSTATPTVTETPTACSYAPPPGLVFVDTPTNSVTYVEQESPCSGGPTSGTNEYCASYGNFAPENAGMATQSQSLVITGVLASSGNDGSNFLLTDDYDTYFVVINETGQYSFTLDGFTTGSDGAILGITVGDAYCNAYLSDYNYDGTNFSPSAGVNSPVLSAGTTLTVSVAGWAAAGLTPYRISVDPYFPTPTPTVTPTATP